nr:hypothetical protein [Tanacetum cinerariifolium]
MSRDVLTVGSTMKILLLYRGEYSQWVERFMNYLEEQADGEAMINSIKNGDQPLPRVTQDFRMISNLLLIATRLQKTYGMLWLGICLVLNMVKKIGKLQFCMKWKQYATMMRQNKNLMDINIDALYNILMQNQGDVNDAMGFKKKTVMVTSDPLALIAEKTKVSKSKEKVVVSSDFKGSDADDFSELKKITALLAKAFNRRKFYSKPTNNNLRTSSTSQSANKKQEFVKSNDKNEDKKADENIKILTKELEEVKLEKDGLDGKLARLLKASKNLDHLIESQRSNQVKEGVEYNVVPPPATDLYLSPKKDLSWTGLPEFVDDTVTDYSRPSPTVVSTSAEGQNKDPSTSEDVALPNPPKPFVKSVKPKDSELESKSKEQETPKKSQVKYAEQYKHSNKRHKGNQRNWNNLKSYQLGLEFVLNKKPCFNYGDFSHLANDCRRRVQRETTRSQKYAYKSPSHRYGGHRPHGGPMRPSYRPAGHRPHGPSINPRRP